MENQILLGVLKALLASEMGAVNVFNSKYVGRSENRTLCEGRIESIQQQIAELEAVPVLVADKDHFRVVDSFAVDKGIKCRWYVVSGDTILNNNALHINDAELLCKLANNQK